MNKDDFDAHVKEILKELKKTNKGIPVSSLKKEAEKIAKKMLNG